MGLLDSLQDPNYPDMAKRKAYNPADFPSMRAGGGFYNALSQGAQQNAGQQGGNLRQSSGPGANQQGLSSNMAFQNEQAARQGSAQLQPYDEQQKQGLYKNELQNSSMQGEFNRQMYQTQMEQAMQNQHMVWNMVGAGAGAFMGHKNEQRGQNQFSQQQRKYQIPGQQGPINNQNYQGW